MSEIELIEIFAGNLGSAMEDARMTQADLARETGLSEAAVSRYLAGARMPTIRAIVNICCVLNCDFEDLIPTYEIVE